MEEVVSLPPPEKDETGETEMHPLENPVVLERLFELIPFKLKDFQRIRLVSRAWHNVSLSTWRKITWLILHDSDLDEDEEVEEVPGISRQKYLDLVENEQLQLVQHPFRKYSLTYWKIELRSKDQDGVEDQVRFWNKVGPLMTHLELSDSKFAGGADFRTVIFEATPNLQTLELRENVYNNRRPATKEQRLDLKLSQHAEIPAEQVQNNLVELEIHLLDDEPPILAVEPTAINKSFPTTWMELLIHFPNIKKLGPLKLGATAEAELLELFKSTEILRKERGPEYLARLTDLNLLQVYYDTRAFHGPLISSINRLQFTLKRLALVINSTMDEETFKQLLQHPLEYLHVARELDEDAMPFQKFPFGFKFMALKVVEICGPIAPNLVFLKECPNLEKFVYNPRECRVADLTSGLNGRNFTRLEKLKCLFIDNYLCNAEQIRKLGELMPNMKALGTGLDDGGFRAVCEVWKELEVLRIRPWRLREEGLLGTDDQSGEKFHHPNLTDLKNLREFDMQFDGHLHGFTDAMILDGLLALPNLETLYLICVSSQVSPYARSQLELKFPECYIFTLDE